jgi:hypothetical protein
MMTTSPIPMTRAATAVRRNRTTRVRLGRATYAQ